MTCSTATNLRRRLSRWRRALRCTLLATSCVVVGTLAFVLLDALPGVPTTAAALLSLASAYLLAQTTGRLV